MKIKLFIMSIAMLNISSCTNAQDKKPKTMLTDKIMPEEYGQAILFYTDKADNGTTVIEVLENSKSVMIKYIESIDDNKINYRYAKGKWTVGEVLQHIISYEQIMTERSLVVAGKNSDTLKFNYYNQSTTVEGAKTKSKQNLIAEFIEVRNKTINAFKSLTREELKTVGTLDGNKASVRMIGLCISGHQTHHFDVLRNRYGLL